MPFRTPIVSKSGGGTPVPPAPGPLLETIDTSDLDPVADVGKAVYIDADNHVALADAGNLSTARVKGIFLGVANQIAVSGPVPAAQFVPGDAPIAGQPFYLAAGTPGKFRSTPPEDPGQWVNEFGLVDDASAYAGSGTSAVTIQPKTLNQRSVP